MKKYIIILIIFISTSIYAQTNNRGKESSFNSICDLCKQAVENNINIKYAKIDYLDASKKLNGIYLSFLPGISTTAGIDYLQKTGFDFEHPESIFASAELNQKIPFLGSLTLIPYFEYSKKTNKEEFEYFNIYQLEIEFSQTTIPYWYKWGAKNPDINIYKINKKSSELNYLYEEYKTIDSVLTNLKNLKDIFFSIEITKLKMNLYEQTCSSYEKLFKDNQGSSMLLFEAQKNLNDTKKELNDLYFEKNNLESTLMDLVCYFGNIESFEQNLKKCLNISCEDNSFDWMNDFIISFPQWNYDYLKQIEIGLINSKKEKNESEYLIQREKLAPQLYIKGCVQYTNENKHNIKCSIGLDFSPLLYTEKMSYKSTYKENKKIIQNEIENKTALMNFQKEFYEETLLKKQNELFNTNNELIERKEIYNDFEKLFTEKKCTIIEYLENEISYYQALYKYELLKDEINYYKLLLSQKE